MALGGQLVDVVTKAAVVQRSELEDEARKGTQNRSIFIYILRPPSSSLTRTIIHTNTQARSS